VLLSGEIYERYIYDSTDSFAPTKTTIRRFDRHFYRNSSRLRDNMDLYRKRIAPGLELMQLYRSRPGEKLVGFGLWERSLDFL
jgi:hypothetical protein